MRNEKNVSGGTALRGREKQRQIAHEASSAWLGERLPDLTEVRLCAWRPRAWQARRREAGGRLLFGLLIGRAHADLFPGKDLPELACLALEHGE